MFSREAVAAGSAAGVPVPAPEEEVDAAEVDLEADLEHEQNAERFEASFNFRFEVGCRRERRSSARNMLLDGTCCYLYCVCCREQSRHQAVVAAGHSSSWDSGADAAPVDGVQEPGAGQMVAHPREVEGIVRKQDERRKLVCCSADSAQPESKEGCHVSADSESWRRSTVLFNF